MEVVRHLSLRNPYEVGYDINCYFRDCHDHDFYEFLLILRGGSLHCVNDDIQTLKTGDVVCVRPDDAHFFAPFSKKSETYEFFNLHVSCRHMETQYQYSDALRSKIEDPELPVVVNLGAKNLAYISQKLKKMNSMSFGEKRAFLYYSILKDLLWHVIESTIMTSSELMPEWFKNYLIDISTPEVFTLDYSEITAKAGVSGSYLWKLFKKYFEMTPTEYINSMKLEYAYEIITDTDRSLGEIATLAGFNSYSYFYREFMKKYNISPKELRKSK